MDKVKKSVLMTKLYQPTRGGKGKGTSYDGEKRCHRQSKNHMEKTMREVLVYAQRK